MILSFALFAQQACIGKNAYIYFVQAPAAPAAHPAAPPAAPAAPAPPIIDAGVDAVSNHCCSDRISIAKFLLFLQHAFNYYSEANLTYSFKIKY